MLMPAFLSIFIKIFYVYRKRMCILQFVIAVFYVQLNLDNVGLSCAGPLIQIFFKKYTVGPLYLQVLHPWIQQTTDSKQCFQSSWESMDARGWLYALLYTILYKGHICGFGITRVLEPIPCGYGWTTVVNFWGNQKLYMNFLLHVGSVPQTLTLFKIG